VDARLARKSGELSERTPHHSVGRFEDAAATEREQRVAAECESILLEMVGDMTERMARGLDDFRLEQSDAPTVPFLQLAIEERYARRILCRAPDRETRKFCLQFWNALNMVGVMMGDEDIG